MNNNLFQNDTITGNSLLGFEFCGIFKEEENVLIEKLKIILNRDISYSNVDYKLLEPTDLSAVLIKDGKYHIVKTPMYSYFEAIYLLPNIFEFLGELKDFKNTYFYVKIGFNNEYINLSNLNLMKFILTYNEDFVMSKLPSFDKNEYVEKITDIKPKDFNSCSELVQKQIEALKFTDDDIYGLDFSNLNIGIVKFKYARELNYRNKWEDIIKCINHTIITLSNATNYIEFDDKELEKIDKYNEEFGKFTQAFSCYELFKAKYKSIKLSVDLSNDKANIDVIYPSIKEQLFNIVICNGIKEATINYDTDVSRLQLKDIELKKCHHLHGVDIVDSEIDNSYIKDCDFYDTKITNSKIVNCNLFGYADCKDSKFKDCFISRNIKLTDCDVYGELGKMGGTMVGGTLKNTTILVDFADISPTVELDNVNEMK